MLKHFHGRYIKIFSQIPFFMPKSVQNPLSFYSSGIIEIQLDLADEYISHSLCEIDAKRLFISNISLVIFLTLF